MLADVIKATREEQLRQVQEEIELYNKPYKRETIIYFTDIHVIGGIETWIQNLSKDYEFSVVYDTANKERLEKFKSLGIETIKNVGQPIECNTLLFMLWSDKAQIKAKNKYLFIHGIYTEPIEIPEHDKIYAVSKVSAEAFEKVSGEPVEVLYNPIEIEPTTKPLVLGVFSRLSKEKGKWRIEYLIEKLEALKKPYLMLVFTDLPFEETEHVKMIKPEMNPTGWMQICDYIVQLSDTEAGSLTLQEALKLGKPLIVTELPMLKEFGIDKTNAKILKFDMSNLDIEDLWNIPVVNWKEPKSKEWDGIMKKRVLRKKLKDVAYIIDLTKEDFVREAKPEELEEKPKKTKKVK